MYDCCPTNLTCELDALKLNNENVGWCFDCVFWLVCWCVCVQACACMRACARVCVMCVSVCMYLCACVCVCARASALNFNVALQKYETKFAGKDDQRQRKMNNFKKLKDPFGRCYLNTFL